MAGFEGLTYRDNLVEQLRHHLEKQIAVWSIGRVTRFKGFLLHIGTDYIVLNRTRSTKEVKPRYILLSSIFAIDPLEGNLRWITTIEKQSRL